MLYLMGKHFAEAGHDVTVFSAQPSYNETYDGPRLPQKESIDGMTVIRTPLLKENKNSSLKRALNYLIFSCSLLLHSVLRIKPYDLMTVSTHPPVLMGWLARKIQFLRGTKYIYHIMDLYPEIAMRNGDVKHKRLMDFAAWVDRRNCECAARVVVLSEDMADTVRDRGVVNQNLTVLNNFIIDKVNPDFQLPGELQAREGKFRVLFAGDHGRFQSLDTIVEAAERLAHRENIEFLFVGAGTVVEDLKKQAGSMRGDTVHFHPYMPINEVMSLIQTSHLGIVSLSPGIIQTAYPSKTMSYLEAGCKLLALVDSDSDLADLVQHEEIGAVCSEPTSEAVAEAIENQYTQWKAGEYDRDRIRKVGRDNFGQPVLLDRWLTILERMPV